MRCDELNALLDLYPGGPLTEEQRKEIEEHLASCPSCRLAAQMRSDARALNEEEELPAGFSAKWRQAVREEAAKTSPKPLGKVIRWLSVAAALLITVGGTWLAGEQRRNWAASPAPSPMAMEADTLAAEDAYGSAPAAGMAEEALTMRAAPAPKAEAAPESTAPIPLGERVAQAMQSVWEWLSVTFSDFLIFLAVAAPVIVILGLAALLVNTIIKRRKHP